MGYFVKKDKHGNEGFVLPSGTTAERPVTPIAATLRYNTSTDSIEYYNAALAAFVDLSTVGDALAVVDEIPTALATLGYTMSVTESDPKNIIVFIQGLYQTPTTSYSVTGTTITFVNQPPAVGGETIVVIHGAYGTDVPTQ